MSELNKINYTEILLLDPLYTEYDISKWSYEEIVSLLFYTERSALAQNIKTIDSYCPLCGKETTFISKESDTQELRNVTIAAGFMSPSNGSMKKFINELQRIGTFQRTFSCPRPESNQAHDYVILFKVAGSKLIKIGQSPSIADLSKKEIKKYRALNDDIYGELNRAIGLSSHGIGVGAFVYLRRIIEKHLVYPALQTKISNGTLKVEDITHIDFKGKIELAKEMLPSFLVENKKIYSVLSKGIHELKEKECREYFQVLKTSIEIILDEEIERIEKDKKAKRIAIELNKIK